MAARLTAACVVAICIAIVASMGFAATDIAAVSLAWCSSCTRLWSSLCSCSLCESCFCRRANAVLDGQDNTSPVGFQKFPAPKVHPAPVVPDVPALVRPRQIRQCNRYGCSGRDISHLASLSSGKSWEPLSPCASAAMMGGQAIVSLPLPNCTKWCIVAKSMPLQMCLWLSLTRRSPTLSSDGVSANAGMELSDAGALPASNAPDLREQYCSARR
mmetsp:Transcript_9205/g.28706  ORF Transcript_9205/g.28706 Transcript_9205/m.28706 type:complete len:215 (+) Transcript_9205:1973-2617(+)